MTNKTTMNEEREHIFNHWCPICAFSHDCEIRQDAEMMPDSLPVEFVESHCTNYAHLDTESGDLFA